MKTAYSPNVKIPINFIIEIGMCRKRNKCALCDKEMDVPHHNIQLCLSCRRKELNKFANCDKAEVDK